MKPLMTARPSTYVQVGRPESGGPGEAQDVVLRAHAELQVDDRPVGVVDDRVYGVA